MTWRDCRLGDVLTLKRGHDLPSDSRHDGDVPVVSSSGITGYHNEAKAAGPGVVTGRYGTIGEVFYVEQDYWPLNTALYVVDFYRRFVEHPGFVPENLREQIAWRMGAEHGRIWRIRFRKARSAGTTFRISLRPLRQKGAAR